MSQVERRARGRARTRGVVRIFPVLALLLLLAALPVVLRERPAAEPPNILLVSIDSLRADHLG